MKKQIIIALLLAILFLFVGCEKTNKDDNIKKQDNDNQNQKMIPTKKELKGTYLIDEPYYVKWEGRYEYKTASGTLPSMVALYHTATGFEVDFYGTELIVEFYHKITENAGSDIYYQFALDDEDLPNINKDRTFYLPDKDIQTSITLISNLTLGHHKIKCLKMDEPADAFTAIVSMKTDGGFYNRNLEEDNKNLKFMFVCASGGSGYGSLAYSEGSSKIARTRANSSSLHSFNYLVARMFNADVQYVAQAGWGLYFTRQKSILDVIDYTGILGSTTSTYQNNVTGAKTTAKWDYNKWSPDIIIFNIGGNDTKQSSFALEEYQNAVIEIVTKLHNYYPNAKMIWTHTNSKAGNYAIFALRNNNILSLGYLKEVIIPQVGDDNTYGASNHNSLKTHITTASKLASAIENYFKIYRAKENINFEDFESILQKSEN